MCRDTESILGRLTVNLEEKHKYFKIKFNTENSRIHQILKTWKWI